MAEVQRCADTEGDCDCERIAVGLAAAALAIALAVAVATKSKAVFRVASKKAADRIRELRKQRQDERTSEEINEWLELRRNAQNSIQEEDTLIKQGERVLDVMRALEQDAFSGGAGAVRIVP